MAAYYPLADFFLSFSLLIVWRLSIWNCVKQFFPLLCSCQLLCFWRLASSIVVEVFACPFFPDIAPSRMFATNSLCLVVCPIHEWRLFFKIFKSHHSSFALRRTSSFVFLFVCLSVADNLDRITNNNSSNPRT
jgi:hypothetical protein